MSKPTIFIVTGAWHTPAHYKPFTTLLKAQGYEVLCPRLPTCEAALKAPYPDMQSDAALIAAHLHRLIEVEGKTVLLAPHSYGGVPTLQAMQESMARDARAKAGKAGGVVGLLSICAFIIETGTSLEALNDGSLIDKKQNGLTMLKDPEDLLFHDLDEAARKQYANALVEQPAAAHASILTTAPAAYKFLPTAVVLCGEDHATVLPIQKAIVKGMRDSGGLIVQEYSLSTSHSPQLSRPEQLSASLRHFIDSLQA